MDTLDYTGPAVNQGSKGVWLGLGDPVRELPREFRPSAAVPSERHGRARLLRGLPRGGRSAVRARPGSCRAPGLASRLRGLAARGAHRRAAARGREPDELPVDDLHPLRARGRHPRRVHARRPPPPRPRAADRDRRAAEAVASRRSSRAIRGRRPRSPGAGGSTSPRAAWRWAIRKRRTSIVGADVDSDGRVASRRKVPRFARRVQLC